MQLEPGSLDGILGLRFMHFLQTSEVRQCFQNYAKWLRPGGILCLTAATPFIAVAARQALGIYEQRKAANAEWPGEITNEISIWPDGITCQYGYLFDEDVMKREAERVGFKVIKCEFVAREFAHTNGKENLVLLAEKL